MATTRTICRFSLVLLLLAATGFSGNEASLQPESQRGDGWRISGGVMFRSLNVSIDTGTRVTLDMIPDIARASESDITSAIGPADAAADRDYSDGYVRQDPGTALDGDTWFWGYQSSAQVQGNRLTFHGDGGTRTSTARTTQMFDADTVDGDCHGVGIYIEAIGAITSTDRGCLQVLISGSFVPFSIHGNASTLRVRQEATTYEVTVTDSYDLTGIAPPAAPYSGDYTGPGPILPNTPDTRVVGQRVVGRNTSLHYNEIWEELDIDLTTLSLGLRGEVDAGFVDLAAAVGPTLNLVQTDGQRIELLKMESGGVCTIEQRFTDETDANDVKFGAFAQAAMGLGLNERMRFNIQGRYDLLDSIGGKLGPSSYKVTLSGYSVMAGFAVEL